MPLFRRQHGTPSHRIRCFIVSTSWHELLVPYSEFRQRVETQTEGFSITVDAAGNVLSAERVTDHVEKDGPRAFLTRTAYLYRDASERENTAPLLRQSLNRSGADGFLLLQLDYKGEDPRVIYPFAAYIVPTKIKPSLLDTLTKDAIADLVEGEEEQTSAAIRGRVEDSFWAIFQASTGIQFKANEMDLEISTPESFTSMTEGGWSVISIERAGAFVSGLVMPDAEVIALLKGNDGDNTVKYSRLASPAHKLDWAEASSAAKNCLIGNPSWEAGFLWFHHRIQEMFPDGSAYFDIYNPLSLPDSLYFLAVDNAPEYVPLLRLAAVSADGDRQVELAGTICWDGTTVPRALDQVFSGACDGVPGYYLCKMLGSAWAIDEELMRRHGFSYCLRWYSREKGTILASENLVLKADGVIEAEEGLEMPLTVGHFIDADETETYLKELFEAINAVVLR